MTTTLSSKTADKKSPPNSAVLESHLGSQRELSSTRKVFHSMIPCAEHEARRIMCFSMGREVTHNLSPVSNAFSRLAQQYLLPADYSTPPDRAFQWLPELAVLRHPHAAPPTQLTRKGQCMGSASWQNSYFIYFPFIYLSCVSRP